MRAFIGSKRGYNSTMAQRKEVRRVARAKGQFPGATHERETWT